MIPANSAPTLWPSAADLATAGSVSPHQAAELAAATRGRLGLLTGTPGTGKTHTTGALVRALTEQYGRDAIAVAAPTGKASVRVGEAMRRHGVPLRATTIHTLLEIGKNGHGDGDWGFRRSADRPLDQQFIIVDEASMVDVDLAAALFSACGPTAHMLWVGDHGQLPPVGHGAPLRDLIAAGNVPCGRLTEIRRNAGLIVHACAAIAQGRDDWQTAAKFDPAAGDNLRHIEIADPQDQLETLVALVHRLRGNQHGWDWRWDVQVLVATNERGDLPRRLLNRTLQEQLNPDGAGHPSHGFKVGDKLICLRNHWALTADRRRSTSDQHYLANGEIGEVVAAHEPRYVVARFTAPERLVLCPMVRAKRDEDSGEQTGEAKGSDFDLAYAVTTHKGQGSEWPVVIVLVDASPSARRVCSREWLYTALSRASQLCITVGRWGVLTQMARRPSLERRRTLLAELVSGKVRR